MTRDEAVCRALLAAFPDAGPASPEWYDLKDQQWEFLAALAAAGWAVVQREPTEAMDRAGHLAWEAWEGDGEQGIHQTAAMIACECIYRAMLAAAQTPPADIPASGPQTASLRVKLVG